MTNTTRLSLQSSDASCQLGAWAALRSGFLTNALNPKTMLFVISAYTQVVQPSSSLATSLGYGVFMSVAHWLWFSVVALFFSASGLRRVMLDRQLLVDRVIGVALIGLGLTVAMTNVG